ncbi:MAG: SRPBCC family protein [Pyrinomonadaceae bacterium]
MAEHVLRRVQIVNSPIEETFEFFSDAGNLEKITPPELEFNIITPLPIAIETGTLIDYKLYLWNIPITWRTEISEWEPPHRFVDRALRSPYKQWIHLHRFTSLEDGRTEMEDYVRYRLPIEPFGDVMHWFVRGELERIFDFRSDAVRRILEG